MSDIQKVVVRVLAAVGIILGIGAALVVSRLPLMLAQQQYDANLYAGLRSKLAHEFALLGVDRLDLPVFLFRGLAAVDEILHVETGGDSRHSTGAVAGALSVARSPDFASRAAISLGVGESRMR